MYFDQKEFGLRVKHLRRKHSLTQEQLADALYITATHLSKIECGQRGISIDLLLDLAAELDVSVDFLISGNPRTMGSVRMLIAQIRELLNLVRSCVVVVFAAKAKGERTNEKGHMMQAGVDSLADAGFHCNVCIVEDGSSLLIYVLYDG